MKREYWLFFLESFVLINDLNSFLKYSLLVSNSCVSQGEIFAFKGYLLNG